MECYTLNAKSCFKNVDKKNDKTKISTFKYSQKVLYWKSYKSSNIVFNLYECYCTFIQQNWINKLITNLIP